MKNASNGSEHSQEDPSEPNSKQQADALPALEEGKYSDGHPLDDLHYLEAKLILKGERFTSADDFREFARLVKRAAGDADIDYARKEFKGLRPQIREVLFFDTADFRLYNNAFILRRRMNYVDGFAVGDPEVVFKFRHPDLQKAADMDVRPNISGDYRIKFKAEVLPLKDQIGGMRTLYSHNAEFGLSQQHVGELTSMSTLWTIFPALHSLRTTPDEKIELVNHSAVEEILLDVSMLDFGKGVSSKSNVSVWRTRGDAKQLVGEFAFQAKFERRNQMHEIAMKRVEQFFVSLQHNAHDWLDLGSTKTGAVYRLRGNMPQAHE